MADTQQRIDQFFRLDVTQQFQKTQYAVFAQHFPIGVAGFDQRVGIGYQAITRLKFNVEILVFRDAHDSERQIQRPWQTSWTLLPQQVPFLLGGPIENRARMSRVAQYQPSAGSEKRADDRRGERSPF